MRPTRSDLALGLLWGATFAWLATRALPPNGVGVGLAVVGAYLLGYGLVCSLVAWGVRAACARRPRLARLAPPLVLAVLCLAAAGESLEDGPSVAAFLGAVVLGAVPYVRAGAFVVYVGLLAARAVLPAFAGEPIALPAATAGANIVVFGMDGMDLDILEKLVTQGRLPNFERLFREGAYAPMKTVSPRSPVVWTTIASGRRPSAHGIVGYTSTWLTGTSVLLPRDPSDRLGDALGRALHLYAEGAVSSAERQVPALWEVASAAGKRSLVINWWASYPAEAISGVVVSNHAIPWARFDDAARAEVASTVGAVSPASVQPQVAAVVDREVKARGAETKARDARTAEGSAFFVVRDDIVLALYDALGARDFPLVMLYTQDPDIASHAYTEQVFGPNIDKKRKAKVPKAEADAAWESLVVAAYERQDVRLGAVMASLPAGTGLLVVSDHGWEYNGRSHWRKPDGVMLAWGGPFAAAGRLDKVHVLDVLPTVAAAMGLPISRELSGKVVDGLFTTPPNVTKVPTYGPRAHTTATGAATADDADHVERLRALGYVE